MADIQIYANKKFINIVNAMQMLTKSKTSSILLQQFRDNLTI